jgi:hypothetical protein
MWRRGCLRTIQVEAAKQCGSTTCKSHVSSILTKLDARDRTELVVVAYESGLVTPGERRA